MTAGHLGLIEVTQGVSGACVSCISGPGALSLAALKYDATPVTCWVFMTGAALCLSVIINMQAPSQLKGKQDVVSGQSSQHGKRQGAFVFGQPTRQMYVKSRTTTYDECKKCQGV